MPDPMHTAAPNDRIERIAVADGSFDLFTWLPASGHGPGVLLLQEIFGVGAYVRAVATRLRDLGYVVAAPDLFWRQHPGWAQDHDEAGMAASFAMAQQADPEQLVADSIASLEALAGLDEVQGRPGVLGFCLGGTLAWNVGLAADPAWVVSYYGSGVPDALGDLGRLTCPTLVHLGSRDQFFPPDGNDRIRAAAEDLDHVTVEVHDAGHAFDNHEAPAFHDAAASEAAWAETVAFLSRHAPTT
ncbi:MAG TPA: dienelactone hydrolase family protein [Aquihabitans sp.]|jgi:carboxymethylenebutenolidase|nr:dienelactone hydrolase family protein [Aquihabitans sp.]